jgi:hypothetical protein
MAGRAVYRIRVAAALDDPWLDWFDGLVVESLAAGQSQITTPANDPATLHGILAAIRDYHILLLSVTGPDAADSGH